MQKTKKKHFIQHETKKSALKKFLFILGIVLIYFGWMVYHYGVKSGFEVTALTWSFFVLCTPIADAGFLLDFPIRMLSGIRMIIVEAIVWLTAISINLYTFFFLPEAYNKTVILKIFKHILEKPFPFWIIIILSGLGTFLSIYFGDELIDTIRHHERKKHAKHKNKHRLIIFIALIALIVVLYKFALQEMGLSLNF